MNFSSIPSESIWQPTQPSSEKPLLVILHGRGDSAKGFESFKEELGIPGLNILLLNAPDPYYTGYSWYDLPPHQLPGIIRSRNLLTQIFDELIKNGFKAKKIILLGFSQGCLMTLDFGSRYSSTLAGYIGISGYCYDVNQLLLESRKENLNANWLITHGLLDPVLPIEKTRNQILELKKHHFNIEYFEYEKSHTIDFNEEILEIKKFINKCLLGMEKI